MARIDWTSMRKRGRRHAAAAPAALAAIGVAMAASSTARPEIDRRADAVRQLTGGDLSDKGLAAIAARMTPSQLAIALRHDPGERRAALYGLTPGWENLSLGGRAGGHGHTDRRQGGGRRGGEPATSLAHRCPVDPGQRQLRTPAGMPARPTTP